MPIHTLESILPAYVPLMAFSQASTQRFYSRPGLAFVPVNDIPPSTLSIAWRTDVDSELVGDFVDTARIVASLGAVPQTLPFPTASMLSL